MQGARKPKLNSLQFCLMCEAWHSSAQISILLWQLGRHGVQCFSSVHGGLAERCTAKCLSASMLPVTAIEKDQVSQKVVSARCLCLQSCLCRILNFTRVARCAGLLKHGQQHLGLYVWHNVSGSFIWQRRLGLPQPLQLEMTCEGPITIHIDQSAVLDSFLWDLQ